MRSILLAAALALLATTAPAQEAVFVIRHAEKAAGEDPPLTEAGRLRAAAWAEMLQGAGIRQVITSDTWRTRETGAIIATALGTAQTEVDRRDIAGLVDLLGFDHEDERVLIVGHAETIPSILAGLGHAGTVEVSQADFASLFVLTPEEGGPARLIRLHMPDRPAPRP